MRLHAVAVGIDLYRDMNIANLSCAKADAEAVATLLEQIEPTQRTLTVLCDEQATKRNIMIEVGEKLPRLVEDGDVVLLYFAGHGSPELGAGPDDVSRYLVAHDSEYDNIYATAIDMQRELVRWFERLYRARLVLLVLDACFSGLAGGRTFEGPALLRSRAGMRGSLLLQGLELGEGRLMLAACDDNQLAREDPLLGHGVFTHYFLRGPGSVGSASTVGVHALYEQLARSVRDHTGGRQTPILNGRSSFPQLPHLWRIRR